MLEQNETGEDIGIEMLKAKIPRDEEFEESLVILFDRLGIEFPICQNSGTQNLNTATGNIRTWDNLPAL